MQDAPSKPGPPTRLFIPKLGIDAPIVPVGWSIQWVSGRQVGVWEVPDGGAVGWHQGTGPLGEIGNTVLNGHNTTGGEVFRNLYTLKTGDPLTVYSDSEAYAYVVTETLVLPEAGQSWDLRLRNASLLGSTFDERVTLVTCHPYGSLRNRLVVIAVPTAAVPTAAEPDVAAPADE
jgi:sortase A